MQGDPNQRQRVLILKLGYTETLDQDTGGIVSLGDVLRTTVILHEFPPEDYHVTWVVDPKAAPLLRGNPFIARLLQVNAFTAHQLATEWFDIVINFEKDPGVCAVADRIPAWRRYGFRFDPSCGTARAYDFSDVAMTMSESSTYKRQQPRSWSEILFSMIGKEYRGQSYILGYRPHGTAGEAIGLNHLVGEKYPLKRWPETHWNELYDKLSNRWSVSWQQGTSNIEAYIEWIHSCRLIVTNDSLGLHLAIAMRKPTVALFGPTMAREIDSLPNIIKLTPAVEWDCIPCLEAKCHQPTICMHHIPVQTVQAAIERLS